MISKILYPLALFIFFSCTEDLVHNNDLPSFSDDNIDWHYNMGTQDLLIQIDINDIGKENIDSIKVRINSELDSDFSEIFDDGQNDDQISGNGKYSVIFNNIDDQSADDSSLSEGHNLDVQLNMINEGMINYQYIISFNRPTIIGFPIPPEAIHNLNLSQWTNYEIKLAIDAPVGIEDIEDVKFYIKKIYFTNTGELINNICEYDTPIEDTAANPALWETFEGWSMNYDFTNPNGHEVYLTEIPMRPINQCGGYGYIQWKFEVYNKKGFYDTFIHEEPVEIICSTCEEGF